MKGTYLGEFQEIVLLTILILDGNAYGLSIQKEIKSRLGRSVNRGALHTALVRLEQKGFIRSEMGGATASRGGRRKRFFTLTNKGNAALEEVRRTREQLWKAIPGISLKMAGL